MRNVARLAVVLFTICVVTSGLLAFVDSVADPRIKKNKALEAARLRAEALVGPGKAVTFSDRIEVGGLVCYEGTVDGKPVGTVFMVSAKEGYAGTIGIMVGVDPSGEKITGVRITEHTETPGLGANIVQVRPGEDEPWFLRQFKNLGTGRILLKPKGEIDAITAATISSRAVTDAVRQGFEEFIRARRAPEGAE